MIFERMILPCLYNVQLCTDLEEPGDVEWDDKEEWTEISRMKTLLTKDLQYKLCFKKNIIICTVKSPNFVTLLV